MFVVTVDFRSAPDKATDFLAALRENAAASVRDEPGCLRFDVCTDPDDPTRVFLYEIYTDAAAFEAHNGRCTLAPRPARALNSSPEKTSPNRR